MCPIWAQRGLTNSHGIAHIEPQYNNFGLMTLTSVEEKLPGIRAWAFTWHVHARCYGRCLSGGGAARELAARAPCFAGCGRRLLV